MESWLLARVEGDKLKPLVGNGRWYTKWVFSHLKANRWISLRQGEPVPLEEGALLLFEGVELHRSWPRIQNGTVLPGRAWITWAEVMRLEASDGVQME